MPRHVPVVITVNGREVIASFENTFSVIESRAKRFQNNLRGAGTFGPSPAEARGALASRAEATPRVPSPARAEAQAAREVERIHAETRRSAGETERVMTRSATTIANVQTREAKRGADAFIRSLREQRGAAETHASGTSLPFSRLLGANFFANLGARAVSSFIGELAAMPREGTRLAAETQNAFKGLESVATFKGIDPQSTQAAVQNLRFVRGGIISVAEASTALKNLLSTGFSLPQAITLMERFSDASAFGKQAALGYGDAIRGATEGIKNQNSILVDNVGITKNLSVILKEHGFELEDLSSKTEGASARQALYNGLLAESQGQVGDADKIMQSYTGTVAAQDLAYQNLQRAVGQIIITNPAVIKSSQLITEQLNAQTKQISDATSETNQFATDTVVAWAKIKANLIPAGAFLFQFVKGVGQMFVVMGSAVAVAITKTAETAINATVDMVKTQINTVVDGINKITGIARMLPANVLGGAVGALASVPEIQRVETGKNPALLGSDRAIADLKSAVSDVMGTVGAMNRIERERLNNVKDIDDAMRKEVQVRRRALDDLEGTSPKGAYKPEADPAALRLRQAQALVDQLTDAPRTRARAEKLTATDREDNEFINSISRNLRAPRPADPRTAALISDAARQFNIPQGLAFAQIHTESRFNPAAVSPQGAVGLGQIMPATGARFGFSREELRDPKKNLTAWGQYMTFLFNRFGDWELAILAYHQGEGTVDKLVKVLTTSEGGRKDVQAAARASGVIGPKGRANLRAVTRFDREDASGKDVPFNADLSEGLTRVLTEASRGQFNAARRAFFETQNREGIVASARALRAREPLTTTDEIATSISQLKQTRTQLARQSIDENYFGRLEETSTAVFERIGGRYQELIIRQQNLDQEYQDQWRNALLEREGREMDYVTHIGHAEAQLHEMRVENLNEASVANRRLLQAKTEELDLTKRLQNLQDEYANAGANQGLREQVALMEEMSSLRRADLDAVEDQVRAQVRLADQTVYHAGQANARVLEFMAEQKSVTELVADARTGVLQKSYDAIDSLYARFTKRLGALGDIVQQLLSGFTKLLLNKAFQALSGGQQGGSRLGFGGGQQQAGGGGLLGNLLNAVTGGRGGTSVPGVGPGGTPVFNTAGGGGFSIPNLLGSAGGGSAITPPPALSGAFPALPGISAGAQSIAAGKLLPASPGFGLPPAAGGFFGGLGTTLAAAAPLLGLGLGASLGGQSRGGQILGGAGGLLAGGTLAAMFAPAALTGLGLSGGLVSGVAAAAPFLLPIAAAALVGAYFLKRNKQRRMDETTRNSGMVDSLAQLQEILKAVKNDRLDGSQAIQQSLQIRTQYMGMAEGLKDSKTRRIASADVSRLDSVITQIRAEADAQLTRQALDRKYVPEFATGGVVGNLTGTEMRQVLSIRRRGEGQLIKVKAGERVLPPIEQERLTRQGGHIPGIDRGVDDTYMRAPVGTLILNKQQQKGVESFATGGFVSGATGSYFNPNPQDRVNFNPYSWQSLAQFNPWAPWVTSAYTGGNAYANPRAGAQNVATLDSVPRPAVPRPKIQPVASLSSLAFPANRPGVGSDEPEIHVTVILQDNRTVTLDEKTSGDVVVKGVQTSHGRAATATVVSEEMADGQINPEEARLMPVLPVPAAVQAMIGGSAIAEQIHAALDLVFGDGTVWHLSTAAFTAVATAEFGAVDYLPHLRKSGDQRDTLRGAVDQVAFTAQNVDGLLGLTVTDIENSLDGARGIFSVIFLAEDGSTYRVVITPGEVADPSATLAEATFKLVSDLDSGGDVAGERTAQISCTHRYKIDPRCGSPDASLTCSHNFDDANGCGSKAAATRIVTITRSQGNQASYGGIYFKDEPPTGASPGGSFDGSSNDFLAYRERYGENHNRYGYLD